MEDAGHEPPVALLESCLQRAERQGDEAAIKRLMDALELQAYKIIGAAAKVRRACRGGLDTCRLQTIVLLSAGSSLAAAERLRAAAWDRRRCDFSFCSTHTEC